MEEINMKDIPIEYIDYRGFHMPIYLDDYGQQYYTILDGEEIGFGTYNFNYKEDLQYVIDRKLDFICNFEDYPGSELTWFFNGYNNRDICVKCRTRILYIWPVEDEKTVDMEHIKELAKIILDKYRK